jgi:hypothetical protein
MFNCFCHGIDAAECDMNEQMKKILNEHDYGTYELYKELMRYYIDGGAICGIGNSMNPWKNNITLYKDYPNGIDRVERILRGVDPEVEFTYTFGWIKKDQSTAGKICPKTIR